MSNWIVWIQQGLNLRLWKLWTWFLDELYLPEASFTLSKLVLGCQATAQDNYWVLRNPAASICYRLSAERPVTAWKRLLLCIACCFLPSSASGKATHVDPNFFELRENTTFLTKGPKTMGISWHKNTVRTGSGEEVMHLLTTHIEIRMCLVSL